MELVVERSCRPPGDALCGSLGRSIEAAVWPGVSFAAGLPSSAQAFREQEVETMVRFKLGVAAVAAVTCVFSTAAISATGKQAFVVTEVAKFSEPWAMTFLPDGRLLVSEKKGALKVHAVGGKTGDVTGGAKVGCGGA